MRASLFLLWICVAGVIYHIAVGDGMRAVTWALLASTNAVTYIAAKG